ncbi:PucR family transcriptional regulator [Niallia sp. Krafla_26]|uniref:PucR family transcriptional regulator n=1 Tax=Niallia sp. Krafla_26 TaxID=3064703 RepID=UPI003D169A74
MVTTPSLLKKTYQGDTKHNGQCSIKNEQLFTQETTASNQTERPYQQLLDKYEQLLMVNEVEQKLMEEVLRGVSLKNIVTKLYQTTQYPWVIHNVHGHPILSIGIETLSKGLTSDILYQYITNHSIYSSSQTIQTIKRNQEQFLFLTNPFFLNEKRVGYCSIILKDESSIDMAMLLLEKVSLVCSLCSLYEKTKIDSSEQLKSFFLRDIINGQIISEGEMITKAGLFHFDLRKPFYICVLGYHFNRNDFQNEITFAKEMIDCIKYFNKQEKVQMLINHEDYHINLFVNEHFQQHQDKHSFFTKMIHYLSSRFPGSHFYLGVSKRAESILSAQDAYNEANMAKRMITSRKQVVYYESLGMIGTLINEKNEQSVRKMAKTMLGNIEVNHPKNMDLVRTLYFFLVNGGNLEKTAEDLSLSISGLRYRVHKIEDLLHEDLRNPVFSCQLLMAIQGLILLGDLDINNILDY